jgi:hypothetical protein
MAFYANTHSHPFSAIKRHKTDKNGSGLAAEFDQIPRFSWFRNLPRQKIPEKASAR